MNRLGFGTMRLPVVGADAEHLIQNAVARGVTWFHASPEYDSWEVTSTALRRAGKNAAVTVAVKLSSPSFDAEEFIAADLRQGVRLVAEQLSGVAVEIQWMVRTPNPGSAASLAILQENFEAAASVLDGEVGNGAIAHWGLFPYNSSEASHALRVRPKLRVYQYLNTADVSAHSLLGTDAVVFRALGAGSPLTPPVGIDASGLSPALASLRYTLLSPSVRHSVGSFSTPERLEQALAVESSTSASATEFRRWTEELSS